MSAPELLLATRSAGKLRELKPLFASAGVRVVDLREAGVPETPDEEEIERFATFEENALAKARHFASLTGRATVADDSGLEVYALGGAPGVRSKRWSGGEGDGLTGGALDAANNRALLRAMAGTEDRRARYVCVAAYVDAEREVTTRGEAEGRILLSPRGTGGFGYDPYFESSELGLTFAEVDSDVKERVSHRGRAFRRLLARLGGGR